MPFLVPDPSHWCLPALLARRAEELGDRRFLSFGLGERELTYEEADRAARAVAAGLAGLGVHPGDRVLLMLRNRAEFVLTWLAAAKLGAVQVPVNVDFRGHFLEHLVNTSRAEVLVVEDVLAESVSASLERLPHLATVVVVGELVRVGGKIGAVPFAELLESRGTAGGRVAASDPAAIHFTSGTSGPSKGAILPHAHLHLLAERNRELLGLDGESVYLTELPLFHINAQMSVYSALLAGGGVRIERRFSASSWLGRVRAAGATHTSLLGVMLAFILEQQPHPDDADNPLRCAWTVPCPLGPAAAFRARFGLERLVTSYGSTELGMVVRRSLDDGGPEDSAGRVEPAVYEIRVVDDSDANLPPGEIGELVVRPKIPWTTTQGYFGMPELTLQAFRNLWFHTGDAARMDDEGNVWFVDRMQDRIRRRGENIASADVEQVLGQHPSIAEAAVVGVPADEEGGEDEIKAVVVPVAGTTLEPDEVWAWCDERLPYYAVPRYLELAADLPRTQTAKVRKGELRASGVTERTADRGPARPRAGRR